jgi:propionyl-CoA carboxylase alpha chain
MNKTLFEKVLVANRGEIALRIMRTLKNLGIKTVAVYSEADTNSLHVQFADEAIYIGPSPATESYLSIKNIIQAAQKSGAQAVHPGYGFLSEDADFAKALHNEGIKLIGPSNKVIKMMGDKIEAKRMAQAAGVTTVPGYLGEIDGLEQAKSIANDIGYPVIIKAAGGGGGRGMRVVRNIENLNEALNSAKREAANSFRDNRIFIERFVEDPRHIEIQVLADEFGNVVCLGERECSIQRHHQKVIEEAPSPFIDEVTRQKMYDQSIALCKMVGYSSAGTVEFIMDSDKNFFFLEMNTRLQVEHCVTELVTGIDIVEQMVNIACGEKLPFTQADIKLTGSAIESRICSEDPSRGFLPSSGRIIEYKEPSQSANIRVDSGVKEGHEVSMFYDPMIAKLCTYAPTRAETIEHMKAALGNFVIKGVSHNISFLEAIMANADFAAGNISTSFIEKQYPTGFLGADLTSEITQVFLAAAVYIHMSKTIREMNIEGQMRGKDKQISTRWVVSVDNILYPIFIKIVDQGYNIRFERTRVLVRSNWILGNNLFNGIVNDKAISVKISQNDSGYKLSHAGVSVLTKVRLPRLAELDQFIQAKNLDSLADSIITAPISGKIVEVKIKEGEEVKLGQELMLVEAMKMENVIYATKKTKVIKIHFKAGDLVNVGQDIIELE